MSRSQLSSRTRDVERHQKAAADLEKKTADLAKRIADKQKALSSTTSGFTETFDVLRRPGTRVTDVMWKDRLGRRGESP
jgi:hypothetical protein